MKRNFVHYDGTLKFMIIDNYFDNVPAKEHDQVP